MGEKQTLLFIQRADLRHLGRGQLKIEDVDVLYHPLLVNRFGNYHDIILQQKA